MKDLKRYIEWQKENVDNGAVDFHKPQMHCDGAFL